MSTGTLDRLLMVVISGLFIIVVAIAGWAWSAQNSRLVVVEDRTVLIGQTVAAHEKELTMLKEWLQSFDRRLARALHETP